MAYRNDYFNTPVSDFIEYEDKYRCARSDMLSLHAEDD